MQTYTQKIELPYSKPFDWATSLDFYNKHKIGNLEQFENLSYKRTFLHDGDVYYIVVYNDDSINKLIININSYKPNISPDVANFVTLNIKKMFDTDANQSELIKSFQKRKSLKKIVDSCKDIRLVGGWDDFESAISVILGQLISIKQATKLVGDLIDLYGIKHNGIKLFPTPKILAEESLLDLKTTQNKKNAIIEFSRQIYLNKINFSNSQNISQFKSKLMSIKGIGVWTAEYIAIRTLHDSHSFPDGDIFLKKIINSNQLNDLGNIKGYLASSLYRYSDLAIKEHQDCMVITTALGNLELIATKNHLISCLWTKKQENLDNNNKILLATKKQLIEYFEGKRTFFDIPLHIKGTEFQKKVWKNLIQVEYGTTQSYKDIANKIGDKKLARAIGLANSKNPINIIIPCHRIIRSSGDKGGYFGGKETKKIMINLEKTSIESHKQIQK